ncbi:MAG: hypothetical protein ACREVW_01020 [Burkholderiales bacterium]
MTPTLWCLLGLCVLLAIALIGHWVTRRFEEVQHALEYRTADISTIESDTRRIQRQVPTPRLPRTAVGRAASQGVVAALRDSARESKSSNPHRPGSELHHAWASNYERVSHDRMCIDAAAGDSTNEA